MTDIAAPPLAALNCTPLIVEWDGACFVAFALLVGAFEADADADASSRA
jgi:hypothetical protein